MQDLFFWDLLPENTFPFDSFFSEQCSLLFKTLNVLSLNNQIRDTWRSRYI